MAVTSRMLESELDDALSTYTITDDNIEYDELINIRDQFNDSIKRLLRQCEEHKKEDEDDSTEM